jgi:hypothetical protein
METYENFESFYQHFLSSHTRAVTRWMHVAGLSIGATGVAIAARTRRPLPALLGIGVGTALLVGSHPVFEGNTPQNGGRPLWGARALVRMCVRQVTGAIEADLAVAQSANFSA